MEVGDGETKTVPVRRYEAFVKILPSIAAKSTVRCDHHDAGWLHRVLGREEKNAVVVAAYQSERDQGRKKLLDKLIRNFMFWDKFKSFAEFSMFGK
jgi:hypothetical protein